MSDHHKIMPISFNSHSIVREQYYNFSNLPSKTVASSEIPDQNSRDLNTNVHATDKVVDPKLKSDIQAKKERIPKAIPVVAKSGSHLQKIIPLVLPRKEKGTEDARRKITGPKSQFIP